MNIFRRMRGHSEEDSPACPPPAATEDREAERELWRAQAELLRSRRQRREAEAVAGRLRQGNEQNHFAELLRSAMKGVIE